MEDIDRKVAESFDAMPTTNDANYAFMRTCRYWEWMNGEWRPVSATKPLVVLKMLEWLLSAECDWMVTITDECIRCCPVELKFGPDAAFRVPIDSTDIANSFPVAIRDAYARTRNL